MKNAPVSARRELQAHRRFVTGMTASSPRYQEVDTVGNKEWVVDVYIGPQDGNPINIIRDVLVTSTARSLVSKLGQPVLLERSKQGKYTVVGRSHTMPSGAQLPEGSPLDGHYHRNEFNFSSLKTQFIPDLTFELEVWGDKAVWGGGDPWQDVRGFDAFGNQVLGVDAVDPPNLLSIDPIESKKVRHISISKKRWGGTDSPLIWSSDKWAEPLYTVVELEL